VYCLEHEFEDRQLHHDGRETDVYDAHSVHAVLMHRPSDQVVGCVRLVLPQLEAGIDSFPLSAVLDGAARHRLEECDLATTAEISRYAVSRMFRHRSGEDLYPDVSSMGMLPHDRRRVFPHVSVGLLKAIATLAADHGIKTVCAAMTPALIRMFEQWGMSFERLGPMVEYHGPRQPCLADCEELLGQMERRHAAYAHILSAAYHHDSDAHPHSLQTGS
jgi:N-acyl amino acid synthase of PEP-CTERM/exosortase system